MENGPKAENGKNWPAKSICLPLPKYGGKRDLRSFFYSCTLFGPFSPSLGPWAIFYVSAKSVPFLAFGPFSLLSNGERKKRLKKTHIKDFRGSQGGGPGGKFRHPNSLCWCHFPQQNTVHREF